MAGRNSIYEVFRACRLCGGGGGYKMPIVNLEDELDMRHKIRECVRIEVHRDDKMPPLICELCVDKVNDYFEFLEMCRATDTRTRDRLGLPQLSFTQPGNDVGDCILGVTEPVYVNDDSNDAEPLARQKNRLVLGAKGKKPATPTPPPKKRKSSPIPVISITRSGLKDAKTGVKELKVSLNGSRDSSSGSRSSSSTRASRSSRSAASPRAPSPPTRRETRRDNSRDSLRNAKHEPDRKRFLPPPPAKKKEDSKQRSILKSSPDEKSLLREKPRPASKREREKEDPGQAKRVKIAIKSGPPARAPQRPAPPPPPPRAEKRRAASPPRPQPKRKAPAPEPHACQLCRQTFSKQPSLTNHLRAAHSPTFTQDKLACNACGEWFRTAEETSTHHRWHKSAAAYVCRLCTAEFRQYQSFSKHFANKQCVPSTEVADKQCAECWLYFATDPLLDQHRCRGEDGRPGGNCAKCKRKYATYKTLKRHEESCLKPGPKSKGGAVNVSPEIQRQLHPMQVRVARCDPLLTTVKQEKHYDVSHVQRFFGLDKSCVYPYISSVRSIKTEPQDYDLSRVKSEVTDDFVYEDNFNYESFTDSDSEPELVEAEPHLVLNPFARKKKKKVDALSTLSIKAIFSNQCLGQKKIQRKRLRRLKQEKLEIKMEMEHPEIDKETKSEMIESCNGGDLQDVAAEKSKDSEARNTFGDMFDDDVERDVRTTVDDLIAGLNNTDDVAPETEETVKDTESDKITSDNQETIKANEELDSSNLIANGEDAKTADKDESSVVKEVIESIQNDATSTEAEEIKTVEESQDKEATETTNKIDTDKNEMTEKRDIERENEESQSKIEGDEDEFDINSIFSGALGSTALKSKGELAHADEKAEDTEGKPVHKDVATGAEVSEKHKIDVDVGEKRTEDVEMVEKSEASTGEMASAEELDGAEVDNEKNPSIDIRLAEHEEKDTADNLDEKTDGEAQNDSLNKSSEKDDSQTDSTEKLTKKDALHERISQDDQQFGSTEQLTEKDDRQIDSTDQNDDNLTDSKDNFDQKDDPMSQNQTQKDGSQENSIQDIVSKGDLEAESMQEPMQKEDLTDKLEDLIPSSEKDRSMSDAELDNISDSELMDDNELMEELDAQIKENTKDITPERDGANADGGEKSMEPEEKISLDDLLMASSETKTDAKLRESMDLDTISDEEFNFDA